MLRVIYTLIIFSCCFYGYGQTASLNINITGLKSNKGQVIARLFTEENHYTIPPDYESRKPIEEFEGVLTFENIPEGEYSVFVWHDENEDFDVNQNFLKIPRERVGFGNNIRVRWRAPNFEETKVLLKGNVEVGIELTKVKL